MSGRTSQRKGAGGERELAALLQRYGYEVRRGGSLSYGTLPDLYGLEGVHIEVKRVERLNIAEAMKQAERDAERFKDGFPTVFHRRNREGWLVTMRFSDWMRLYSDFCREKTGGVSNQPQQRKGAGGAFNVLYTESGGRDGGNQ